MSAFPKYTLRGLEGRRIITGSDSRLVVVEGKSDVEVYSRFIDDPTRIYPVEDIANTARNNRRAIVSLSEAYPHHSFIVDEDMESLISDNDAIKLPDNLATTFELNDIECWAFQALEIGGGLSSLGLIEEDIALAINLSMGFGILRMITKEKLTEDEETRWKINFGGERGVKRQLIRDSPKLQSDTDIVDLVIRIYRQGNGISTKRWQDKFRKREMNAGTNDFWAMVGGHDLCFFLYYVSSQRKGREITNSGLHRFETSLRRESIKERYRKFWSGLMNGKVGHILGVDRKT